MFNYNHEPIGEYWDKIKNWTYEVCFCDQKIIIDNGEQQIATSYWGYNGTVVINLDEENGFRWLAKTQNYV